LPFGEEAKYPYVGTYNVEGELGGSKYSIGRSSRPKYRVGSGADGDYHISGSLIKTAYVKTMKPDP
jgi:hypothetical protein